MKHWIILLLMIAGFSFNSNSQSVDLNTHYVVSGYNYFVFCGGGKVSFQYSICESKLVNAGLTLMSVSFNTGDGNNITKSYTPTSNLSGTHTLEHQYSILGDVQISGTVTFSDGDGNIFNTNVYFYDHQNPFFFNNNVCDDPSGYEQHVFTNHTITIETILPDFSTSFDGSTLSFFNHSSTSPSSLNTSNFYYELYMDSNPNPVCSGSGINSPTSAFCNIPISSSGQYGFELIYYPPSEGLGFNCPVSISKVIDVVIEDTCDNCSSFTPLPGKKYWLSAWVKEDVVNQVKNYGNAFLRFQYAGSSQSSQNFYATGEIIDEWQRIVGEFTIPIGTTDLQIDLVNNGGVAAYYDDIRIHPFNGSMKSYVYDPETLWLTAELDDNNYATFYEYDKEGKLIRIKKETSRGIMTIQESRSRTLKKEVAND